MRITSLSASSYGLYDFCQWKWYLRYVLKFPDPSGPSATLGHIVHKFLEVFTRARLVNHDKNSKVWNQEWVWTVTCKHYERVENASCIKIKEADLKKTKRTLMEFMESSYSPLKANVFSSEDGFEIKMDNEDEWVVGEKNGEKIYLKLIGYLDRVDFHGSDTVEIIDYKNGKRRDFNKPQNNAKKEHEDMFNDFQLRLYHLVAKQKFPDRPNVIVTIIYLNDGGAFSVPFCDEDIPITVNMIRKRFNEIKDNDDPKLNKGWHCKTLCTYGKNGVCKKVIDEKKEFGEEMVENMYNVINPRYTFRR